MPHHHWSDRLAWRAGRQAQRSIARGALPRLDGSIPCRDCGQPATMYDHRTYARPLEVDPVCRTCNRHRGEAQDAAPRAEREYRRDTRGRLIPLYPVEAVIAATNPEAPVRIEVGDRRPNSVAIALRSTARRRGVRVHCRCLKDAVLAWSEPA